MDRDPSQESQDLPEGVVNAEPTGGWESGDAAGAATDESSGVADAHTREAMDSSDRYESGPQAPAPQSGPDGFVESAEIQQGLDPDISTDAQTDED